jgi:hypothetical protein
VLSACERCNGGQQLQRTTSILCRSVQQQSASDPFGEKRERTKLFARRLCLEGGSFPSKSARNSMAGRSSLLLVLLTICGVSAFATQPLRRADSFTFGVTSFEVVDPGDDANPPRLIACHPLPPSFKAAARSKLFKEADGATSRLNTKELLDALHKALPPDTVLRFREIGVGGDIILSDGTAPKEDKELVCRVLATDFESSRDGAIWQPAPWPHATRAAPETLQTLVVLLVAMVEEFRVSPTHWTQGADPPSLRDLHRFEIHELNSSNLSTRQPPPSAFVKDIVIERLA